MKRVISAFLPVVLVVMFGQTQRIYASHQTYFGSIDEIDAFLPEGGGVFSGSLSDVNDDDWVGFFATVGDTLSITFTTVQVAMDGVVFREVTNGILEVGDAANVTNFGPDRTGEGEDLVVQHGPYGIAAPNYTFGSSQGVNSETLSFMAAATGFYVIGISSANEGGFGGSSGPWSIALSGNTGGPDSDGDGVTDDDDDCPDSNLSVTIFIDTCDSGVDNPVFGDGCTLADLIDEMIAECVDGARNHGQYVRCFARSANDLKKDGIITGDEKGALQSCAAQSKQP